MFGSPGGIYDSKKNLSIASKGITSTHPDLGFRRKDNFYVNMISYPGSCGSPIFLCNSETMQDFSKTKLLGVFCETQNMLSKGNKTQYMNLGLAVPAYYLLDFKQLI